MPDDLQTRVMDLFSRLLDTPVADRPSELERLCAEDRVLRDEVASLLDADSRRQGFLDAALVDELRAIDGDAIPGYTLIAELGRGGMGVVYRARQHQPEREVAVKVMQAGLTPGVERRFEQEIRTLARLAHPGIARIYDAGTVTTPLGSRPWFSMELVEGPSLARLPREGTSLGDRVRIVIDICVAIQEAHGVGIIHRDLKPANIIMDAKGRPKVLDFGVARLVAEPGATNLTAEGGLVGTLPYMSPEQVDVRPDGRDLDTRSDIYAIGVVAYELFAGVMPYAVDRLPPAAAARLIAEVVPPRLGTIAAELRGDLEAIVAMALEKDPARRYASAEALAADLRRYLEGAPIMARPPTAAYLLEKLVRRHAALATAIAALVLLTFLAAVIGTWLALRAMRAEASSRTNAMRADAARDLAIGREADARAARDLAHEQIRRMGAVNDFYLDVVFDSVFHLSGGPDVTVSEVVDALRARVDDGAEDPALQAIAHGTLGYAYLGLRRLEEAEAHLRRARQLWLAQPDELDEEAVIRVGRYLGLTLVNRGRATEALEIVRDALRRHDSLPADRRARTAVGERPALEVVLGLALLAAGEEEDAVRTLATLLSSPAGAGEGETVVHAALGLAGHYARVGRHDDVVRVLMHADATRQVDAQARHAIRAARLHRLIARAHLDAGRPADALPWFERVIADEEHTTRQPTPPKARAYYEVARVRDDLDDLPGAEARYRESLTVYLGLEDSEQAHEIPSVEGYLGRVLVRAGRSEEGARHLAAATAAFARLGLSNSAIASTELELGRVLVSLDREAEAVPHLSRAWGVLRDAELPPATLAEAASTTARALVAAGHLRQARSVVEFALARLDQPSRHAVDPNGLEDLLDLIEEALDAAAGRDADPPR